MYILKLMGGEKFIITDEEFTQLANADGKVFIKSCNSLINTTTISSVYPESNADEIETRKNQQLGVCHDGTLVKRHFGEWVIYNSETPDDIGKYQTVKLNQDYYPEVARDCVSTPQEYEKIKHLPKEERLKLILKGTEPKRIGEEFSSLENIIENKKLQ